VHERGAADVNINLAIAFVWLHRLTRVYDTEFLSQAGGSFKVNGAKFVPPSVPVLLQVLSGAQPADALLPSGSVISLPPNKVIELSIPAGAAGGPVRIFHHGNG
jgi:iron transport multicopper oxidase